MVVLVITADVGGHQPHHVGTEVAIVLGPERQVKVIGHQAVGEQAERRAFRRLGQELEEGSIVAVLVKHGTSPIASIEDMIAVTALRSTCGAWHAGNCRDGGAVRQGKKYDVLLCRKPIENL